MTVRLLDELDAFEKLALIDMSYSRIESFLGSWGCPAKYFFTYIQGEESQFGAAATLGNVVHSTLEEKIEPNKELDYDIILQEFMSQLDVWDPEKKIDDILIGAGKEMLAEFVDRHQGDTFPTLHKEMPFQIVVGSGFIRGFIDRVDFDGEKICIVDYKTGKNEVSNKDTPTNLQLGIYALALKKLYPEYPIYASLYYLRSGRQKGHLFSDDDLVEVESKLVKIIDMIVHTQNFGTTSNARICWYCDHGISGACGTGAFRIRRRQK